MFENILATVSQIGTVDPVSLNGIGKLLLGFFSSIGSVGVAVILFTLIVKVIPLPLDVFSRFSTKKNEFIMQRMKPQLEKLKKQYANNPQLYQQKLSAVYKKEGYSMFGACLPLLVSLVFFWVVFAAFQSYSRYAVVENYNEVVKSYNAVVQTEHDAEGVNYAEGTENYRVIAADFAENTPAYNEIAARFAPGTDEYKKIEDAYKEGGEKYDAELSAEENFKNMEAAVEEAKNAALKAAISAKVEEAIGAKMNERADEIIDKASEAAKVRYNEVNSGFLWVKNIWVADSALSKAVPNADSFQKMTGTTVDATSYDLVTGKLDKDEVNGYFILPILCMLFSFLSQFIMQKLQKNQTDLQATPGQPNTMKMMTYVMPILFGFFALSYSGSFTVYMIVSSVYSTLTTLLINWIAGKVIAKKMAKKQQEQQPDYMKK